MCYKYLTFKDVGEKIADPVLERSWLDMAAKLGVRQQYFAYMQSRLSELKSHHLPSFEHSLRVGMLAARIGEYADISPKALFYSGLMHDIGKLKIPAAQLDKKTAWTKQDALELEPHPVDSYNELLVEGMTVTAGAVVLHHTFQANGYPKDIPGLGTEIPYHLKEKLPEIGRIVALADYYDACHRSDSDGNLSGDEIRAKVYENNPDVAGLIDVLYQSNVFSA